MIALRELRRALRDQRRHGAARAEVGVPVGALGHAAVSGVSGPTEPTAESPASIDLGATLAEVRAIHPRLHASLVALDPSQQAAVLADDRAVLVRAQVGSGKTTVLVHKVLYLHLVRGVPLDQIAVLTFTNRAADQLRARLDELAERATSPAERWLMGTFHGVAATLLRRALPVEQVGFAADFAILDEDARDAMHAELIRAHGLRLRGRRLRDRLRAVEAGDRADPAAAQLVQLARVARDARRARNAMDFDDLIDHACALLAAGGPPRLRWILVDELQDCEPRELELLRRLRGPGVGFFGVGDPLQAIYGWRGSAPETFARAEVELGCRVRELPISYRCTRTILDGARAVLGAQPAGGGTLAGARDHGARLVVRRHHDAVAEAVYLAARLAELGGGGVPCRELAVLCRLRAQVESMHAALVERGVPCAPVDAEADADDNPRDAVRVLTLHAAKGLELRHVFIAGANLGVLPLWTRDERTDLAEERRLLFVGITRARDGVELSYHATPHQPGALCGPSPLLYLLPAALVDWHDGAAPVATAAAALAASPPATDAPWQIGQPVRHRRYGAGTVVALTDDTVECDFGKLGARGFPRRLCPLTSATGAAS